MPAATPCPHNPKKKCHECRLAQKKAWREANPNKALTYRETEKHKRETDPEFHAQFYAKRREKYAASAKTRERMAQSNYRKCGIVFAPGQDKPTMLEAQGWVCTCGRDLSELSSRGIHVDRDHSISDGSPNVREILCSGCNQALGNVSDSIDRLYSLIEYLERWQCRK